MQKKLRISSAIFKFITLGLVLLCVILTIVGFSSDITITGEYNVIINYESIWSCASFMNQGVELISAISIILFGVNALFLVLGFVFTFKKSNIGMIVYSLVNLLIQIVLLVLLASYINNIAVFIINIILAVGAIILCLLYTSKYKTIKETDLVISNKVPKLAILILAIVGLLVLLVMFFVPVIKYIEPNSFSENSVIIADGINVSADVYTRVLFIGYLLFFISIFVFMVNALMYYRNYEKLFAEKIKTLINIFFASGLIIFVACFLMTVIDSYQLVFGSFLSFILMTVVKLLFAIFRGRYIVVDENIVKRSKSFTVEPTLYMAILLVITIGLLFVNIITIEYIVGSNKFNTSYNGLDLIQNYKDLGSGYQILTFVILAVIIISSVTFVLSLCAYFAKYREYHKLTKTYFYLNIVLLCILGLSSFYFKIAQEINEENILSILNSLGLSIPIEYVINIKSSMIYLAIPALAVMIVALFRGKLIPPADPIIALADLGDNTNDIPQVNENNNVNSPQSENKPITNKQLVDFDACPVFTELDSKKEEFDEELKKKEDVKFESPTLPSLVEFIVEYACESRLHLSYSKEDIATFIAGLGASRLTILQGMSGTGKTSLPKIFSEAIFGNCEIVEVESSWRDKNELLGYYNEFSRSYSPKKFTQKLYKAKLNENVITFIVLDEMNLSRIEYYFSDFLSLMENEEEKREIKLLNVKLERIVNNEKFSYQQLVDGHTIKIPTNVWFIGTANRDESTFEISDKVYDRAQTMNFNKRAPKARPVGKDVPQRYLSYNQFSSLLKSAINGYDFNAEDNEIIKEVEKIMQPFNISFGNRVLKQIEEFVKIYCACFNNYEQSLNEAIEKIILSKIVAKLEFKNVENKDKLIKQFNKLGLEKCSEFVSRLNED